MPFLQQDDPDSTRHSIVGNRLTIGRPDTNDVTLMGDMRVSRHHAVIERETVNGSSRPPQPKRQLSQR